MMLSIGRPPLQEDDVILRMADHLRSNGWVILACGGNQIVRFRFQGPGGRRKSPDLVAWRSPQLLIVEVKVRKSDLFRLSAGGHSDASDMQWLMEHTELHAALIKEAREACLGLRLGAPDGVSIVVAGLGYSTEGSRATEFPKHVAALHFDVDKGEVSTTGLG